MISKVAAKRVETRFIDQPTFRERLTEDEDD
jgi:hypothetical protein